jgi:UDP-N-acetylmuramate--alanine ligase
MNFDEVKTLFFVGIGGIGMSGLARYFKQAGKKIYGYDRVSTSLTKTLEAEGMTICYTEDLTCFPEDTDLIIRTPAVPGQNVFLKKGLESGIPVKKRSEILGMISQSYRSVAVAGTHGKTTTSAMMTWLLRDCGIECSAFLGGIAVNFQSNFLYGRSDVVVLEADEYDRSFLQLSPDWAIITSMDADHLDIYGSHGSVQNAYIAFADGIKSDGTLVIHESIAKHIARKDIGLVTYGFDASSTYRIEGLRVEADSMQFDLVVRQAERYAFSLPYPGQHNVENATAALAVAMEMGLNYPDLQSALRGFKGIKRRFEWIGKTDDVVIIDDYAHHPTEIQAAISAARLFYPGKRLTGVFQPHLYSRTRDFYREFAGALDKLDACLLVELYPAREEPMEGVSSQMILDAMTLPDRSLCSKEEVTWRLLQMPLEVVLIMGAGDIDTLIPAIKEQVLNEHK